MTIRWTNYRSTTVPAWPGAWCPGARCYLIKGTERFQISVDDSTQHNDNVLPLHDQNLSLIIPWRCRTSKQCCHVQAMYRSNRINIVVMCGANRAIVMSEEHSSLADMQGLLHHKTRYTSTVYHPCCQLTTMDYLFRQMYLDWKICVANNLNTTLLIIMNIC